MITGCHLLNPRWNGLSLIIVSEELFLLTRKSNLSVKISKSGQTHSVSIPEGVKTTLMT